MPPRRSGLCAIRGRQLARETPLSAGREPPGFAGGCSFRADGAVTKRPVPFSWSGRRAGAPLGAARIPRLYGTPSPRLEPASSRRSATSLPPSPNRAIMLMSAAKPRPPTQDTLPSSNPKRFSGGAVRGGRGGKECGTRPTLIRSSRHLPGSRRRCTPRECRRIITAAGGDADWDQRVAVDIGKVNAPDQRLIIASRDMTGPFACCTGPSHPRTRDGAVGGKGPGSADFKSLSRRCATQPSTVVGNSRSRCNRENLQVFDFAASSATKREPERTKRWPADASLLSASPGAHAANRARRRGSPPRSCRRRRLPWCRSPPSCRRAS